jgi:pyrroloquinoline quinone (PQQ) biosynthesis protein C
MPFYDEIVRGTVGPREAFMEIPAVALGLRGLVPVGTYLAFLAEAYQHVRHTVPLLMACGARLGPRQSWLRHAVAEYISEEIGHEDWILNDIQHAGGNPDSVRDGNPGLATELMVAYAYDSVQRGNPVSMFGMVFVLEGTSVVLATRAAAALKKNLSIPDAACTYLESHGSLDQEHLRIFSTLMNRLDSDADRHAVLHAANVFYHLYGNIFRSLPMQESTERNAA